MFSIKTDSRKVKNGDTFVALRGLSSDGHDYIEKAIQNGATTIVAEEGSYSVETKIVEDTTKYLEDLLYEKYHTYLEEMVIVGVTGTNGKTTTSYLLYEALNKLNKKAAYIGTVGFYKQSKVCDLPNTSPALCDMYEMLVDCYETGYRYVVMEVSSQGLSYGRMNTILFDYAIFTNLTQDHLDYHKTMENYALAKQKLFHQLKENGISIVNIDDEYHSYYEIGNVITYGCNVSNYKLKDMHLNSFNSEFSVNDLSIHTSLIGKYNVYNVLCAVIVLDLMKIEKKEIERVIPTLSAPPGRMDMIPFHKNTIIIDYAHTPDAMENIIHTVEELPHKHIYIVFGCTGSRDAKKRPIMMRIALEHASFVVVTSDDLHEEEFDDIVKDMLEGNDKSHYKVLKNRYEAVKYGMSLLHEEDLLLILGKGHEEFIIVHEDKIPFNDRKAVEELIAKESHKIES